MNDTPDLPCDADIRYLRNRRSTYFFGDPGPPVPAGATARWRLTPSDPQGWHANMVGFVVGPVAALGTLLDTAINWFTGYGANTWVDADEYTVLFKHPELLHARGFRPSEDWEAMVCRRLAAVSRNASITLDRVQTRGDMRVAAWIAEQSDRSTPVSPDDQAVGRRMERYWREYVDYGSRYLIAALDGRPAGTARLTEEDLPVVVGVATVPEARRQGIATTITATLAELALRERGACALYADRGSQAARIYARLGFQPRYRMRTWVRPYRARPVEGTPGA